ncbi:hypothetical protein PSH87_18595 [Pseudomonas sp. FP453]|jgi:hypothetical protein|uniref:hypothetical protein n=1 Tax=Pseudomonas sp. FP453 TaxID=2954094 RepID=UPI002733D327|nr:hypothetical protein [Pseudomonas sp. FP453]WLH88637.1 hypothetical protein PSH87_18595 [Pseudomonas sp. FP453]
MRRTATQPFATRAWIIALLIGLAFAGLEYGLSLEAEQAASPETRSWLELGLFLCAYLFAFCLKPIQATVQRRLYRSATQQLQRKAAR